MGPAKSRCLVMLVTLMAQLTLAGCLSSIEPDVDLTPSLTEDTTYYEVLTKSTIKRTVFKNFETRAIVSATYLSPEFRAAFSERLERVFKRGDLHFDEAKDKAAFFVSVEVPGLDMERADITNPYHWSVMLNGDQGPIKPILIKRIVDKERWRAFFVNVNNWSSEYLVIFDVPAVNANSPKMVVKTPVRLTIANADAQLNLSW